MNHREPNEESPDLEPWVNDERLQNFKTQGTINKVVRLILRVAEAMEEAPIGPMPKTKSIPMMWEMVKDLKPENIRDLQDACREHAEYGAIQTGQKTEREKFARDLANLQQKSHDKRPADEMSSAEEEEMPSSKERKRTASDIFGVLQDEGTCANSNFNCMTLCPLLRAHTLVIVTVQTIPHALFGASTHTHVIESPAACTYLDTHVLDNVTMQNCCCHTQLQLI
jgi:hypothetical protein